MIKKILLTIFLLFFISAPSHAWFFNKKEKPVLIFTTSNPEFQASKDEVIKNEDIFKVNERIYFLVYTSEGFKSDYIKYQVIKQDDNAHVGGYSRVRNKTCRIKDKNYYSDYIVMTEAGKYALQVFDIENLHHWIAFGHFRVVSD